MNLELFLITMMQVKTYSRIKFKLNLLTKAILDIKLIKTHKNKDNILTNLYMYKI